MNAEIFVPMFYMVLLTFTVSLVGTIVRFKNVLIDKKHTGIEMMKFSPPSSASVIIKQADRNLTNLFEFPILFYAISIVLYRKSRLLFCFACLLVCRLKSCSFCLSYFYKWLYWRYAFKGNFLVTKFVDSDLDVDKIYFTYLT